MTHPINIKQNIISKIDYIFIFNNEFISNRKRLYNLYCYDIQISFDNFCLLMDNYTNRDKNDCIIIDRKEKKIYTHEF